MNAQALEQGQQPFENLIEIKKAHDIRRLCRCPHCDEIGDNARMVRSNYTLHYFHGRCFAEAYGANELLALPAKETDKLCIGDLGVRLMRKLLNRRMDS